MSSGIFNAVSGAVARMQQMDVISENLANSGTVGFKQGQVVFEKQLASAQDDLVSSSYNLTRIKDGFTDFSQGPLTRTDRSLDLAISGEGFFKVRADNGQVLYTRRGALQLNPDGVLTNSSGMPVLSEGGSEISLGGEQVVVAEDGNIEEGGSVVARLALVRFSPETRLERQGGGAFAAPPEAVEETLENRTILQAHLEQSNVDTMAEMARMVEAQRVFEACQKMIKAYDDLASKADDLGSL